jgi:predicted dinucleotide-binding enzyme
MRIGIIGAGNIGGTLARRLAALGHDVSIANSRGPASLAAFAKETGARAVSVEQAARSGDVVIISIPEKNIARLPANLFDGVSDDVVVVDTGNYYPQQRDGRIEAIENGSTESRWVAERIGRPVVKAFNNIYANHLRDRGRPKGAKDRIALPVAGDDKRAKDIVIDLLDQLGFERWPRPSRSGRRPSARRRETGNGARPPGRTPSSSRAAAATRRSSWSCPPSGCRCFRPPTSGRSRRA